MRALAAAELAVAVLLGVLLRNVVAGFIVVTSVAGAGTLLYTLWKVLELDRTTEALNEELGELKHKIEGGPGAGAR